ncbi:hypothetical protein K438DRAFT_1786922 [Mycena galopus ATCC 62051]|nr:hypothetical protein K438DRAFT_1786922 [Mycena galopus ATCC 62051]
MSPSLCGNMVLPTWQWRAYNWYESNCTFMSPVAPEVLDSKAEQAFVHHAWDNRNPTPFSSREDKHRRRRFAVGQLACSAAIAHIRCAVQQSFRFEHWVYNHASNPTSQWEWGSGAGWGSTRGNVPWAPAVTTTLPASTSWPQGHTTGWGSDTTGWGQGSLWETPPTTGATATRVYQSSSSDSSLLLSSSSADQYCRALGRGLVSFPAAAFRLAADMNVYALFPVPGLRLTMPRTLLLHHPRSQTRHSRNNFSAEEDIAGGPRLGASTDQTFAWHPPTISKGRVRLRKAVQQETANDHTQQRRELAAPVVTLPVNVPPPRPPPLSPPPPSPADLVGINSSSRIRQARRFAGLPVNGPVPATALPPTTLPALCAASGYLCGHSHCFVCIRIWLEREWKCPECAQVMHIPPFRHYGEENSIAHDYPFWTDDSRVSYSFRDLIFPQRSTVACEFGT